MSALTFAISFIGFVMLVIAFAAGATWLGVVWLINQCPEEVDQ